VSALYRRIHDLESENRSMKEQLREPGTKAESRPHDEDEALPPQGLRTAKAGACKGEDRKVLAGEGEEEEEELESQGQAADDAGERSKKKTRPVSDSTCDDGFTKWCRVIGVLEWWCAAPRATGQDRGERVGC
jgi:hypothetical protein